MNKSMPRTPFSAPLSGPAKEPEICVHNIFSEPKKRPSLHLLILMCALCIFCGNLAACHVDKVEEDRPQQDDFALETQGVPVDPNDPPASVAEEDLLQALYLAADEAETFQSPIARLLTTVSGDSCILGVTFVEDQLENTLILGVMDRETKVLTGPIYRYTMKNAVPNVMTYFYDNDGVTCLLYTCNGQVNGQYTGEAGLVRFDGTDIAWIWPVEGDIRDKNGVTFQTYKDYWTSRLALMAPGGVDIYEVNPAFEWGKEEPASMWQLGYDENFYRSSKEDLPMPIYFQSLNWLVEHTNDPGGWRIVSLTLNDERCDPEKQTDCYTLQAEEELGTGKMLVDLFFPYETEPDRPRIYDKPNRTEIYHSYEAYTKSYAEQ